MNLDDFKKPQSHRYKANFEKYSLFKLAGHLKISSIEFKNILDGNIEPDDKLQQKIKTVAEEIQQEEIRLNNLERNGPLMVRRLKNRLLDTGPWGR